MRLTLLLLAFALSAPTSAFACDNAAAATTATETAPKTFDKKPAAGTKATCPVTGEVFTVTDSSTTSEVGGKVVVFCCPGCKPKFDADPKKYLPES